MDEGEGKFRGENPAFSQWAERAKEGQREDTETKGLSGSAKYQDGRGAGTPFCKGAALIVQESTGAIQRVRIAGCRQTSLVESPYF